MLRIRHQVLPVFCWNLYLQSYYTILLYTTCGYLREFFVLFRTYFFVRPLIGKTPGSRHGQPGRTHWSRSGRDPCPLERVASPQSFFRRRERIIRFPCFQYERPYSMSTCRGRRMYRYKLLCFRHRARPTDQTTIAAEVYRTYLPPAAYISTTLAAQQQQQPQQRAAPCANG